MWILYFVIGTFVIIISPRYLNESSRLRYFACWASLITSTAFFSLCVIISLPFSTTPRSCLHVRKGSAPTTWTMKLIGLEFDGRDIHKTNLHDKFIIVINHQSFMDVIVLIKVWHIVGNCVSVAKKSMFYYWPFGIILKLMGTIFIDRSKKGAAYEYVLEQAKDHFQNYKGKTSIVIFPEGSRGNGKDFLDFKHGAFKLAIDLKVPILPVVIAPYNFMKYFEYFKKGKIIYRVLDPISTADYTLKDMDKLIDKTKQTMFQEYQMLRREQDETSLPTS